ncbi:hypothetical protein IL306_014758 [Fusarium sp. DS 682]|nr:hypothetical protein IL306_014758 [Fusarium sp. DS 682]
MSYGTTKAATVASHMLRSFRNIHIGLMVGIGGGVPTKRHDIRLGDVVVGDSVIQYDLGKTERDGKFQRTGDTGKAPPDHLKTAVQSLRARHDLQPSPISRILAEAMEAHPSLKHKYARPAADSDRLFLPSFDHVTSNGGSDESCDLCDPSQLIERPKRPNKDCKIHYGKIASGNQVMKHGETRDRLSHELGVICFEMEAAGLIDANLPCLVIRGISDYADSHKNNQWRGYAAAAAAAYTKELLSIIPIVMPRSLSTLRE